MLNVYKDMANEEGITPLSAAAEQGHDDVVCALIAAGADKDRAKKNGDTALSGAAANGHEAVVCALRAPSAVKRKANIRRMRRIVVRMFQSHISVVAAAFVGRLRL